MKALNRLLIISPLITLFAINYHTVKAQIYYEPTIQGNLSVCIGSPVTYKVVFTEGQPPRAEFNSKGVIEKSKSAGIGFPVSQPIYTWSITNGTILGGAGTSEVTVQFGSTNASISVSVEYTINGTAVWRELEINVTTTGNSPSPAGIITGSDNVCTGVSGVVYSISPIPNAIGYSWSLPSGASITSGSNTNSITVNFSSSALSGNISVCGTSSCGNGIASTLQVTVVSPSIAGNITGLNVVKPGTNGVSYSVTNVAGASSYFWEIPNGATIASGINTNSIAVNYPSNATSGIVKVTPRNGCGSGIPSNMSVTVGDFSTAGSLIVNPADAVNSNLRFKTNGTNLGIIGSDASINSGGTTTNLGMAVFGNNSLEFSTNGTKRFVINGSGNIGIGTALPIAKLDVIGDINISAGNSFKVGGVAINGSQWLSGSNNSISYSSGNIGIGTTTPSLPLEVNGGIKAKYLYTNDITGMYVGNAVDGLGSGYTGGLFYAYGSNPLYFYTNGVSRMYIKNDGNIGIGVTNPHYKLTVEGTIAAREVKVTAETWADFVFHPTYKLRTLGEVEQFIKINSHLPEIPTVTEIKENGISLGEMNAKLLQKIEELTLYMIEQQKQMVEQQKQMVEQQKVNEKQNQLINEFERKLEVIANKK